jgi:hypothetical protein
MQLLMQQNVDNFIAFHRDHDHELEQDTHSRYDARTQRDKALAFLRALFNRKFTVNELTAATAQPDHVSKGMVHSRV